MESAKDDNDASDLPSINPQHSVFWTRETTQALLNAYETQKDRIGKDFRFQYAMWVAISTAVNKEMGENFTPAQCENRFRVLVRSYRRAIDTNLKTDRRRKEFEYLEQMRRIMKEEKTTKSMLSLSETGVFASGTKSSVQIGDICSELEPVPSSCSKQLFISSGKSNVNSNIVCGELGSAASGSKQVYFISGKSNVKSDKSSNEPETAANSRKQLFLISAKTIVNSDGNCSASESSPSSGKQVFIISGNPSVNTNSATGESAQVQGSGKQLFVLGEKSNVNRDSMETEPTPSSNEPEAAASSSKELFISPSRSSVNPQEKRRKVKKSFMEHIMADRKLYHEQKLLVDKERLEGLERRNDELLQLKKMKLEQTERLVVCEEERLKCEKEKLSISREKLKMYVKLVQLQEESNEILRSINDQLDFLL